MRNTNHSNTIKIGIIEKWFRKAAKQGNKDALEALKELGETL